MEVKNAINQSSQKAVYEHLVSCNNSFVPPLDQKVNLQSYSQKIKDKAVRFEAWNGEYLVGLIACYINKTTAFITNVSTDPTYAGKGIASTLLGQCIAYAKQEAVETITLEVNQQNTGAIYLYNKFGFITFERLDESFLMKLEL